MEGQGNSPHKTSNTLPTLQSVSLADRYLGTAIGVLILTAQ